MKTDIVLCGVGGQGILSIATVIGEAATKVGLNLKQAEVHGMSQRGGDVQSNLRLSTEEIFSDLIPEGKADLIISMEPMECLRYLPYLSPEGCIVTSSKPFVNIPDYPDKDELMKELGGLPHIEMRELDNNMVLLGMAARHLDIIGTAELKDAIARVFAAKGDKIVETNQKAFDEGYNEYVK